MTTEPVTGAHDGDGLASPRVGVRPGESYGPLVNLHYVLGALRRRRRWWIGLAVLGFVVGALLSVVTQSYRATTTLRLQSLQGADPARAIATDKSLLETRSVARRAVRSLGLHMSAEAFVAQFSVTALSDELLRVSVTGPSSVEAVRRSRALATQFLRFRKDQYDGQLRAEIRALEARQAALRGQLAAVDARVEASPLDADALLIQRGQLNTSIEALQQSIEGRTTSTASAVSRSQVIDLGSPVKQSAVQVVAINAGTGAVAGLAVGLGLVTVLAVASDRLRRREDVALAMSAPVRLSVGRIRGLRRASNRHLRRRVRHPDPELRRIVAHLRSALPAESGFGGSLAVVSVDSLDAASLAVCELANQLGRRDHDVIVADLSGETLVARLLAARRSPSGDAEARSRTIRLAVADTVASPAATWFEVDGVAPVRSNRSQRGPADVVVALAVLDPATGADHLRDWATDAIAVVTAGRSTASKLHAASEMVREAGLRLRSVVLIAADPDDESIGIRADGLSGTGNGSALAVRPTSQAQTS